MDTQSIEVTNRLVRISPRKLRLVADVIRGKDALSSLNVLRFMPQKGSDMIAKVVKSAVANATHNHHLKAESLFIEKIIIDEQPTYKRGRAASKGRPRQILKRNARIRVTLRSK